MNKIDQILKSQQAWQALSADDEAAIRVVALDALSRCAEAIAVLGKNLRNIGYTWVSVDVILADALRNNVKIFEETTGLSMPKILVGFVCDDYLDWQENFFY